jgi:hypothetical protein
MFDAVGPAAVEMAAAAVDPAGGPDMLGDLFQVDRFEKLAAALLILERRVAAGSGKLAIGAGGIVAGQAIDILGFFEVEIFILPTVAGMTAGAPAPVGDRRDSVVVQDMGLAEYPASIFIGGLPAAVQRLFDLFGGLVVTLETGSGNLRTTGKRLVELREATVVGGRNSQGRQLPLPLRELCLNRCGKAQQKTSDQAANRRNS